MSQYTLRRGSHELCFWDGSHFTSSIWASIKWPTFVFPTFKYSTRWQKGCIKRSANPGFINRGFQVGNLCVPLEFIVPTTESVCVCVFNYPQFESTQAFAADGNIRKPDIRINSIAFEVTLVGLTSSQALQCFNRFNSSGDCIYTVTT